jgi:hemolysin activation/secretion protein
MYLTADLRHLEMLPEDLRWSIRASGQIADSPLISNEQFAAGGVTSVRGYHSVEQLGDDGVNLSTELQSPRLAPKDWEQVQNLRALAFVDWAYLWVRQAQPGQKRFFQMFSPGAGLRFLVAKKLTGELDWSYPFIRQGTVDPGNQRVDFRMAYEF